jgi:protoporphyrinogen oxidase
MAAILQGFNQLRARYATRREEMPPAKREKYDVIVVGAGPGGVTCAALLAKKGLHVLVLDKNERVGGKQMTVSLKGYKGERWPTGGLPVKGGAWLEAFRALGIEPKFQAGVKNMSMLYQVKRADSCTRWIPTSCGPQHQHDMALNARSATLPSRYWRHCLDAP